MGWIFRDVFGADGQFETQIVGVRGVLADGQGLKAMATDLDLICRPARDSREDEAAIISEVTKTMAVTAGRNREGMDDDVAVDTFVDELSRYPLDCVRRALGSWRRGEKWRPTLADLIKDTEWRAKPRLVARDAVRKALQQAARDGQ